MFIRRRQLLKINQSSGEKKNVQKQKQINKLANTKQVNICSSSRL